jgi:hypothetical protein
MPKHDAYLHQRDWHLRLRALGWLAYFLTLFLLFLCFALLTF